MADNKNIVDDVLSKGIFGKVATKYTSKASKASKSKVVKEAIEELPPVVEQPEPEVTEPVVVEKNITVKPVKTDPVKNAYNKGAFRDIASRFVKGTLVKMIDPNKEVEITEEKEILNNTTTSTEEVQQVQEVVESKEEKSISATIDYVEKMLESSASITSPASFNKDAPVLSTTVQDYINAGAQKEILEATMNLAGDTNMSVDAKLKALERKMMTIAANMAGGGSNSGTSKVQKDITTIQEDGVGGIEFTGGFAGKSTTPGTQPWDSGTGINITTADVAAGIYKTFSLDRSVHLVTDSPYWSTPTPLDHTDKGVFGGAYLPPGASTLFDFTHTDSDTYEDGTNVVTTGRIRLNELSYGDTIRVRFDFNVIPQIANTTIEPALWYKNRDDNNNVTYSFNLPAQPVFYGTGTVGQTYLNRVEISAYLASNEDLNALAYPAIKSDNPVLIQPISMLVTVIR